ncbi:MAG TPA: cyclic nucleotide-binding domain-containing protein, partial [Longimicrobiaceae bacterium]|nr:cyclic nucleotide-binding domain-containing protein [Longimicrobiaceae bacterium]
PPRHPSLSRRAMIPTDPPAGDPPAAFLDPLGEAAAAALRAETAQLALREGDPLFAGAPPGAALYVVRSGLLHAVEPGPAGTEALVRAIGPGEAVDEFQLLAGAARPVTVRAARDSVVGRVPGEAVDRLAEEHPELRGLLQRLHGRQLLCRMHTLFGAFDARLLDDVEATADWVHLARGRLLFEQDTPAEDGIYVVVSGRVQTLRVERDGSTRVVCESGRGEVAGELAFFGVRRREERVQAVRDSVLVGFTTEEFDQLCARQPQLLRRVTRGVVERMHRGARSGPGRVVNVAVLPASAGAPVAEFCNRLMAALGAHGPVLRLDAALVDARLAEDGISQAWDGSPECPRLLSWLEAEEAAYRFVVYQAEPGPTPWTRRCMRQADRVLLVARADDDPAPGEAERALLGLEGRITDAHEVLVLLHPDGTRLPSGTRRWLEGRRVDEHLHLRWSEPEDFARLARVLAGRAVGVVLGGGGARGLAHIGVLRALREAGVPIDMVGGTSMGAAVSAQHAMGWSPDEILRMSRRLWTEVRPHTAFTLPFLSIINHRKAEVGGRMVYGETEIEDLWLPYFCISSNLATAEMVVHRSGRVRHAALASACLPGAALPMLHEGNLLVDGALMNNVPADVMRQLGCGTVLASEVSVEDDADFSCERVPSTWEVLRGRARFPSMMEVAMRASMLNSIRHEREALRDIDLCFHPPIDGYGLMDFTRMDEIVEAGYTHAAEALRGWKWSGPAAPGAPGPAPEPLAVPA